MKKLIEVHDDWCDKKLFDVVENFILTEGQMLFQYSEDATCHPNDENKSYRPAFSCGLVPQKIGDYQEKITTQILKRFCEFKNIQLENILQSTSFINLPTSDPFEEHIHTDLNEHHYVLLYYINDSDGNTVLFEDDRKTVLKSVEPKKGRVVFFDGSIPHRGTVPSKNTRAVINFNFTFN